MRSRYTGPTDDPERDAMLWDADHEEIPIEAFPVRHYHLTVVAWPPRQPPTGYTVDVWARTSELAELEARFPQLADRAGEDRLGDELLRPHGVEQRLLRDHPAGVSRELDQHLHVARLELDRRGRVGDPVERRVNLPRLETEAVLDERTDRRM